MDSAIQYVTTRDGVRIAYAVSGRGPVLVHMPNLGAGMLELERQMPERAKWSSLLERRFTLVRYDARGSGYSQRDVEDVSLDAHLGDLDAVVSAAGIDSFSLFGFLWSAYLAPYYAARAAEKVSSLILWPPDVRRMSSQEYQTLAALATSDWETFTETYAHLAMGWERSNQAHRYALIMRESVSAEMFLRQMRDGRVSMSDLEETVSTLDLPVLVLQRKMRFAGDRVSRLTAALPQARLQILEGEATVPYLGDSPAVADTMSRFVAAARGEAAEPEGPVILDFRADAEAPLGFPLTAREREIVRLLAAGKSNREIAEELVLSIRTVERHLFNIYNKIGVSGKSARAAAAAFATRRRLA